VGKGEGGVRMGVYEGFAPLEQCGRFAGFE
jgi:hypothetical protein